MKKLIISTILLNIVFLAKADYFGLFDLDTTPFQQQYKEVEYVDPNNSHQQGSIILHHVKNTKKIANGQLWKTGGGITISTDAVASGVRAAKPAKEGSSITQQNQAAKRKQAQYNAAAAARRQARAREIHRQQMEHKRQQQEAENRRVAATTAAVNASLQASTNQAIARDEWHATEGARQAQQTGRVVANAQMRGPQVVTQGVPRQSGHDAAERLKRGYNKPRRVMRQGYTVAPKHATRAQVGANGNFVIQQRATKTSIHIKKDPNVITTKKYNAPKMIASNTGFRLSPNATVTTGRTNPRPTLYPLKKFPKPVFESEADRKLREELHNEILKTLDTM